MKRLFWWTLFGISGAGLPAMWLGQSVLGQPEMRPVTPIAASATPDGPAKGSDPKPGAEPSRTPDAPVGQIPDLQPSPLFPEPRPMPMLPTAPAPLAPLTPSEPALPAAPGLPSTPAPGLPSTPTPTPAPPASLPTPAKTETPTATPIEAAPGRQAPSLSIEWNAPTSIRIHQPIPCQILVKNTSGAPLHDVVVRHRIGAGVACKSSEPRVNQEGGELTWALGTLAPNQTRRIDLVLVTQTRGTLNCQATATFTAVVGHHVQVREPQIAVKMRASDKVVSGETVNLLVTLTNPGDGVAESVKVSAQLPEGLEHSSGRRTIDFDAGNLKPQETKTLQLSCIARGSGAQKCTISATADGNLTASDTTNVEILVPKLDVVLSGPKLRYLDRRAVYVVKVTNPGSAPAANVEVTELIPSGFKFQQANHGGNYQETTRLVTWNLGDLQPGQSKEISVDLIPIEAGDHRVAAYARTGRGLKSEAEIRTVVEGLPSLFVEVGNIDDPIEVGAETAYEIRVANAGTKTETNVEVVCTLPEQLEFKGAKCTSTLRYRQEGRDLIFEALPKLAPKADVIYRVQVRGIAPGDIRFRTKIRADGLKEPLQREEVTRIYSDDSLPRAGNPATTPTPPPAAPMPTPTAPVPGTSTSNASPAPVAPALPTPTPAAPAPIAPALPTPAPVTPTPIAPAPVAPAPGAPALPTPAPVAPAPIAPALPTPGPIPALPPLPQTSNAPANLPLPAPRTVTPQPVNP